MKNSAGWRNAERSGDVEFIPWRRQLDQTNGLQGFWYPPVAP
jgi:hypothetical protein